MKIINYIFQTAWICLALLISCTEDEYPQATITFYPTLSGEANEPNEGASGSPVTIQLITSRTLSQDSYVNIRINGEGAGYGYSYVTNPPQLEPGIITLKIPQGESTTSFTFTPVYDGLVLPQDYHYTFTIVGANNSIKSKGQDVFALKVKEGRLKSFTFDACSGTPAGFTEEIVPGAMATSTWVCTSFGFPNDAPNAMEANAYGKGDGESNSYLIMESIDANLYQRFYVDMEVYSRFSGPGVIKLLYSNTYSGSGNPEADGVEWTELTDFNAQFPIAGSKVWAHANTVVENVSGEKFYFAVQFVGGTKTSSANWRIDNFEIKAE